MNPRTMQRAVFVFCWAVLGGLAAYLTESTAVGIAMVAALAGLLAWWTARGAAGGR
jgi:CHASE2 domain-containing sensor protein